MSVRKKEQVCEKLRESVSVKEKRKKRRKESREGPFERSRREEGVSVCVSVCVSGCVSVSSGRKKPKSSNAGNRTRGSNVKGLNVTDYTTLDLSIREGGST